MKIGLFGKTEKIGNKKILDDIQDFLMKSGYETAQFSTYEEIDGVDVVIVLGGDGAILHASVPLAKKSIKIIGINYGTLGFLTEYERDETEKVKELLSLLEKNACRIVKRSLLELKIGEKTYYALNEIAIQRDNSLASNASTQILSIAFTAQEGSEIISGDGVLICTPTGSTAYSLSAGGAILTPEVPVFMMTPICAFSMRARPIVFSDEDEFTIKIKRGKGMVLLDGKVVAALSEDDEIYVKKAPFTADFPVKDGSAFFTRIKNKLNG